MRSERVLSCISAAIALGLFGNSTHAQTVNAVVSGQADAAATWSNGAAPDVRNNYVIGNGFVVNTPPVGYATTLNYTFGGDSLTVQSGGTLQLRSNNTSTTSRGNYIIRNLTLESGSNLTLVTNVGTTIFTLQRELDLASSGSVTLVNNNNASGFTVSLVLAPTAALRGGADINLRFNANGQSGAPIKSMTVSSANNPYTGNWNVSATNTNANRQAALIANAVNALGTGTVTLTSSTLINQVAGGLDSIKGVNAGTGSTVQVNANWNAPAATLALNAANARVVIAGANTAMTIGNLSGVAGSSITGTAANESLNTNTTINSLYGGTVAGSLAFTQSGPATLTLSGNNTYTGATNISAGTLQLGNGGTSGSIVGDVVVNNGTLAFNRSNTLAFGGVISGTGGVTTLGPGSTILTADNDYTGVTTITAGSGTLQLGDGGTTGSIAGDVLDDGTLSVNRSDTVTLPGVISGNGVLSQDGTGTTVLTGNNTYTGGTLIKTGTLQIGHGGTTGSVAGDITDNGRLTFNRSDTMVYTNVISGTGGLTQLGPGTLQLEGVQTYAGPTNILAGTLAVNGSIQSDTTTISPGATLSGFGHLYTDVSNQGTVWPGHAIPGDTNYGTLTIHGNYVGQGGLLELNTYLGTDTSPSGVLAIDGGAVTGTTGVIVHNTAGSSAPTMGNGILVVSAINGATTTADAFNLLGQTRSGALDYRLFRGSLDGSSPDSWYLRDEFIIGPEPPPEPPPPDPDLPPNPPPEEDLPPGIYPIIGPEVATYGAVQPVARELGLLTLGTKDRRIGDSALMASSTAATDPGPSAWGRLFAINSNNTYRAFAAPHTKGNLAGFQTGGDLWQGELLPGHVDRFGGYVAYGNADIRVRGLVTNAEATGYVMQRAGSLSLNVASAGVYWTHYGPGGWYIDGVAQASAYRGDASTADSRLDTKGVGFMGSLEFGYPFSLPQLGSGFVVEPQVQAIWQEVRFGPNSDGLGEVALGSTNGGTGRVGLRGKWQLTTPRGQLWEPYVAVNLWRDWGGRAATTFGGGGGGASVAPLTVQGRRAELAGGVTGKLRTRLSVYGSLGYEHDLGNTTSTRREGFNLNAGLRYTW